MKSSLHHGFDPYLAKEYGLHEAILIHHFQFWIHFNLERDRNFIEDRTWTFQTMENISAHFPYLSRDQVKRTIKSLIAQGVIQKKRFNKLKMDRTNWYSFVDEENFIIGRNRPMQKTKSPNAKDEIAPAIPDNKPVTEQDSEKDNVQEPPKETAQGSLASNLPFQVNVDSNLFENLCRRFKLVDSQRDSLYFLLENGVNSDEKQLTWWAKTYPFDRIRECTLYAISKYPDNLGGYIHNLLKNGTVINEKNLLENRETAKFYQHMYGSSCLEITKKYVTIFLPSGSTTDLQLTMQPSQFATKLQETLTNIFGDET